MRIYTRTGDDGTTALAGGRRVPKSDARVAAYGAVDEANAHIGAAIAHLDAGEIADVLRRVQSDMLVVGADLADTREADGAVRADDAMVARIEAEIDRFDARLEPLSNFILPGGARAAAFLHVARAAVRRAETLVAALGRGGARGACAAYLNRVSDLLFVLARAANKAGGVADSVWRPKDTL